MEMVEILYFLYRLFPAVFSVFFFFFFSKVDARYQCSLETTIKVLSSPILNVLKDTSRKEEGASV